MVIGFLAIIVPIMMSVLVILLLVNPKTAMLAANIGMVIPTITLAENSIFLYIGVFFYLFRNNRLLQCLTIIVFAVINAGANSGFIFTGLLTTNTQWMMIFAIIPILLYNGQKRSKYEIDFSTSSTQSIFGYYTFSLHSSFNTA